MPQATGGYHDAGDFDRYYGANIAFHDVVLGLSDNARRLLVGLTLGSFGLLAGTRQELFLCVGSRLEREPQRFFGFVVVLDLGLE